MTKYIPHEPTEKQIAFLLLDCKDAFYGGAAGGGKSDALLMAALQYADIPDYHALIIRDSFSNLTKPDSLIPRAEEWLMPTDAKIKDEGKQWIFPSGATLNFGYLDSPRDHFNYQSSAYQYIAIDEAVNIREYQAIYLFSRLRKIKGMMDIKQERPIPLRFRCASNPPAREQLERGAWVKERYVDPHTRKKGSVFIPAGLSDNPYLDKETYIDSLMNLDPITRAQLLEGDWEIKVKGRMFDRTWFKIIDILPEADIIATVRYWDLAGTEPSKENKEPCFTAGCKMHKTKNGQYIISSMVRERKSDLYLEQLMQQTAYMDGKQVPIWEEQEPGSSGKNIISHHRRNILSEFIFRGDKVDKKTGGKVKRASPFASQAEAGNVLLLNGYWVSDFLDEIEMFPDGKFLDQVDASSGAYSKLAKPFQGNIRIRSI